SVLRDVQWLAEDGAFSTAAKRFGEFRIREERHIRTEEELLTLMEQLPEPPRVVVELREEHVEIRRLLQHASAALACRDPARFLSRLIELQEMLAAHQDEQRAARFPEL